MNAPLDRFIELARQKGMDTSTTFLLLRSFGWKEREIAEAMAVHELGIRVPERVGVGSARDAFFHLLAFTALYAWTISLIFLLFTFVDFALPDPATRSSSYAVESALSGMRASLATLIVAFPLFIGVWWFLLREVWIFPEKAKSGIRRWLSFLSLFAGAVTILTDVITLVHYLVDGDLSVRFLLKVAVLFVVTGSVFVYLALTLREEGQVSE